MHDRGGEKHPEQFFYCRDDLRFRLLIRQVRQQIDGRDMFGQLTAMTAIPLPSPMPFNLQPPFEDDPGQQQAHVIEADGHAGCRQAGGAGQLAKTWP